MSDSEQQVSRLADLLAKQLEASAKREEVLTTMMERLLNTGQTSMAVQGNVTQGDTPSPQSQPALRGPVSVPIPHELPSSISLREFNAWKRKLQNHATSQRWSLLPKAEQRSALLAFVSDDWSKIIRYQLSIPSDADLDALLDTMYQRRRIVF